MPPRDSHNLVSCVEVGKRLIRSRGLYPEDGQRHCSPLTAAGPQEIDDPVSDFDFKRLVQMFDRSHTVPHLSTNRPDIGALTFVKGKKFCRGLSTINAALAEP